MIVARLILRLQNDDYNALLSQSSQERDGSLQPNLEAMSSPARLRDQMAQLRPLGLLDLH